jgi:hypothetical protein
VDVLAGNRAMIDDIKLAREDIENVGKAAHLPDRLPIHVFCIGGNMTLHIGKAWSDYKICKHVDDECEAWTKSSGHTMLAFAFDILGGFGERQQPARSFERNARGKWTEIKLPRHYSDKYFEARERAIKAAIDAALAEAREGGDGERP